MIPTQLNSAVLRKRLSARRSREKNRVHIAMLEKEVLCLGLPVLGWRFFGRVSALSSGLSAIERNRASAARSRGRRRAYVANLEGILAGQSDATPMINNVAINHETLGTYICKKE